jgi:hypothetical protein
MAALLPLTPNPQQSWPWTAGGNLLVIFIVMSREKCISIIAIFWTAK